MISLLEIAQSINEDPRGVDNIDRSKGAEKKDQDADRVGRDDGETWMAPNGDYGGKYKGEIEYFDDEDSAKVYAKSGSTDSKGGEEKPEEPKGNIGKGDFDRDFDDTAGDPDDAWDDEEGSAKPAGKTDADSWEDDEEAKAQAYADMEDEEDVEEETISINGKKYKAIKESKKNPQLFKEIYERTFRSLK